MKTFKIKNLPLEGLKLVTNHKIEDGRGFLSRIFCIDELPDFALSKPITQINHTFTKKKGSIRGFHYQESPYSEIKLVNCIKGRILDIAVDIRPDSKTYLKYFSVELSYETNDALLIPEGFAHGFQSLSDDVEMLYFHSVSYNKKYERGINPFDKAIGVDWPLEVSKISQRDSSHPNINKSFKGVIL
tara:strand:+ start:153 stop:713 length:561 start_codon:yes stop_codon:yes gene_type:complete